MDDLCSSGCERLSKPQEPSTPLFFFAASRAKAPEAKGALSISIEYRCGKENQSTR